MSSVPTTGINPADYKVFPHVAVLDEFRMTNDEGSLVAIIDARFIDRLVRQMTNREVTTGDLCPVIIGHTKGEGLETDEPVTVGVARNWQLDDFFDTGKKAAFADIWIRLVNRLVINGVEVTKTADEIAEMYRRRSAEVWADRYEIDPLSLLGATTPARDLGPLKFSRSGSVTYFSPGDIMPTPAPVQTPTPAPGAAGVDQNMIAAIGQLPVFQEISAALKQLTAAMAPPTAAAAPPGDPGAAGAPPAGDPGAGQGDELSDEELAQLLGGDDEGAGGGEGVPGDEDDDESRKGKQPVQNMGGPGGTNTAITSPQVKLNRKLAADLAETRVKLARMEIKGVLGDLRAKSNLDVNPDDEELVSDLAAMEPSMRNRAIDRLKKNSRPLPSGNSFGLETAYVHSTDGNARRIQSRDDMSRVMKLARDKGTTYEAAAAELGFTVG